MERTSRRGRMLGATLMVFGATTLFLAGTASAASVDPVLNPEGNDNPSCSDLGYEIEAKHDSQANAGESGSASGDGLVVNWTFNEDKTIDFEVDETSEYAVAVAIVKQASDKPGGGANVYTYEPPVLSDTGLVDPRDDGQFSHITFCGGELPPPPTPEAELTIVKAVTGDVPADWSVSFTGDAGAFTLGATEGDTNGPQTVEPGTYVVTEVLSEDDLFDLTSIECTGATSFTPDTETGSVSIELADEDAAVCTFTNDYPEVQGSVTVTPKPVAQPTPAVSPAAQPAQVESLAFTGSSDIWLALTGGGLVLLGMALVAGSRRREALES